MLDVSINEYSVFTLNHSCFSKTIKEFNVTNLLYVSIGQFIKQCCMLSFKSNSNIPETTNNAVDFIKDFILSFNTFAFIRKGMMLSAITDFTQSYKEKLASINGVRTEWVDDYVDNLAHFDSSSISNNNDIKKCTEVILLLGKLKKWKAELLENEFNYIDKQIENELKRRNIPLQFSQEVENSLSFFQK